MTRDEFEAKFKAATESIWDRYVVWRATHQEANRLLIVGMISYFAGFLTHWLIG